MIQRGASKIQLGPRARWGHAGQLIRVRFGGKTDDDHVVRRRCPASALVERRGPLPFQRTKVRDLYDLHRFATKPFDGELLRALVVLKLWQVRDPFVPDARFEKLRSGKYDWADLQRLLRDRRSRRAESAAPALQLRATPGGNLAQEPR